MCGIAGYLSRQQAASRDPLFSMLKSVGHRGPDSYSGFVEGGVAMGTARLAIVDLAGGTQPAVSDDRRVAVVFNGEIFNFRELRAGLEKQGHRFRTRSEVETLLHLYLQHGEGFVSLVKGQFAIAVWDGRGEDRLLLYRDRFGIRPLFWHRNAQTILFASEIKGLLSHPAVQPRLNAHAILQTIRFWTVAGDTSAFEGVKQVPAGHYLKLSAGEECLVRYWQLPVSAEVEPLYFASDEDYFAAFREQLDASIRRQRMADVPVGSYLSGGIDSTVVAARLSRQIDGPLKTYSVTFDDPDYDESFAQDLVARRFGFDHHACRISSGDISRTFPQVVWQAETPLFRTAPVPLFLLSRAVRKDGLKVVMTGEGADEMLLGYDLFKEVAIRLFWEKRPESKWRGRLLERLYRHLPQYRNRRYIQILMDFYRTTLQGAEEDPHYAMAVRWGNGKAIENYLSPVLREQAAAYDPCSALQPMLPPRYPDIDHVERAQQVEVATLLSNYLLASQGDRMSMSHGVEGRYPYLDDDFVAFVARLPRRIKLRGLRDKFVLRHAFGEEIPDQIRNRPKVAYQAPEMIAFFENGKMPDYAEELLSRERIQETGLFDPGAVDALIAKGRSATLSRLGMRDSVAYLVILSTMLLDELYVRSKLGIHSDIETPNNMELV